MTSTWTAAGYSVVESLEWLAAGVETPDAAWEWRMVGCGAAEAGEWIAAGVTTPAHAADWAKRGLGPGDARVLIPRLTGETLEWMVVGAAILWPATVPEDTDPDAFPSPAPAAVFVAARTVWRARGGGPEPLDKRAVVAELRRAHPEHPSAVWLAALHRADLEAIMLRDCHLPLIAGLRRPRVR
jgi:hypothetical protein